MEIKVRALDTPEQKSTQQIEQELLEKHEQETNNETTEVKEVVEEKKEEPQTQLEFEDKKETTESVVDDTPVEPAPEVIPPEISEKDVLSYIGKRYNKEITSLDELTAEREKAEPLPEDVASYLKYKKDTGRGIEDYANLQKDFSAMSPDSLLREYIKTTEGEGLDEEDIDSLMEEFNYDSEVDDEAVVKKTKLAKKRTIAKAKKFFNEQKELYKQPLESRQVDDSNVNQEELIEYRQYLESVKTQQEENKIKRSWFLKKTDEVFTDDFKGFDFVLDDKTVTYSPGEAAAIKKSNETPLNFISKYLDDKGLIKDAGGYHRALTIATNPDKFAKFFYEQGKSNATEDVMRKTKNINMTERKTPEVTSKAGFQVRAVNPSSGRGLKIKSINKLK